MPEQHKTPRKLPTQPDYNREVQICKIQNIFPDGRTEAHASIYAPYGFLDFGENPDIEPNSVIATDNKKQFLAAIELGGATEQEKEAHETVAYHMSEILNDLSIQAKQKKPLEYLFTSQIVQEAIRRAKEDGIDSPYLTELYLMQHPEEDTMDLPLPGLQQQKRYPAPPFIYHEKTTLPVTMLSRNLNRIELKNIEQNQAEELGLTSGAFAQIAVDKRPHTHYIYMLMLNKLAEEYPITAQDKNILIAMGNLYGERQMEGRTGIQGGSIITAEDIIRRYRGLDASATIEEETIRAIEYRIKTMMHLIVSFDFTQHFEYRKRDIGDGEEVELDVPDNMKNIDPKTGTIIRFSYKGNMIHANEIEVEYSTGRIATAFEILKPPIVYDYAQKIKQVATIETKLLDLRKKANGSKDADVMKVYLLERIMAMIDAKTHMPKQNFSTSIRLEKLFEDLRIDVQNRMTKKRKTDTVKAILDHFKETEDKYRETFIKGYIEKKGYRGAVTGYEILF